MASVSAKQTTTKSVQWRHAAGNTAVLILWLWLYRPVFDYLAIIFSREDFRTNQILLLGVIFLIATQIRKGGLRLQLDAAPRLAIKKMTPRSSIWLVRKSSREKMMAK
ncbi:MAG: hypothetical protein P8183_08175 [Anaerolineae bacterium]